MVPCGFSWFLVVFRWFRMVSYGFEWFLEHRNDPFKEGILMVSCGFLWFLVVSHGFLWFLIVLNGFSLTEVHSTPQKDS